MTAVDKETAGTPFVHFQPAVGPLDIGQEMAPLNRHFDHQQHKENRCTDQMQSDGRLPHTAPGNAAPRVHKPREYFEGDTA